METVQSCQPSGKEWNGKIIYSVHLSDGRGGESFTAFPVGTPVSDLQIEQNQYGLKFKKKQSGFQGGGGFQGKQRGGNESFALAYSKDLVVAGKVDIKQILPTADKLYAWLEGKKAVAPAQSAASIPVVKQTPIEERGGNIRPIDDDLPF